MDAKLRNRLLGLMGLPVVMLLCSCGRYTITFEVADVINAPRGDQSAEMLDVDIVCVTKQDAQSHPEIVEGRLRAAEWFNHRDEDNVNIKAERIYALRAGDARPESDTLKGEPLLGAKDRKDAQRATSVRVHHPQCFSSKSAIVIYGRFQSKEGGIANQRPLVIQPLPLWKKELRVKVGREGMALAE